jgi:hypothetical protein
MFDPSIAELWGIDVDMKGVLLTRAQLEQSLRASRACRNCRIVATPPSMITSPPQAATIACFNAAWIPL